jgi:hypothetical protein
MQINGRYRRVLVITIILLVFLVLLSTCDIFGWGCPIVANEDAEVYFKVDNDIEEDIQWYLPVFAFSATLRPGECTRFGISRYTEYYFEITRLSDGYTYTDTASVDNDFDSSIEIIASRLYFRPPE